MAMSLWRKAYWTFAGLGGLWAIVIAILTTPDLQRFAIYANKFHTAYWSNLDRPEKWGFLENQVQPFNISSGSETIYAWHILPLGVYRKHEAQLLNSAAEVGADAAKSPALNLLKNDPNSKIVIKFHGNAGHVAQGWRPDTYRMLGGAAPDSLHVLAFDYRGFGYSTGTPTEDGVIADGIAMVEWAMKVAGVSSDRIVLYGQSLGTAVATAVAEHFAVQEKIEFAGLVLTAPFSSMPELLPQYFIAGFLPTLSPLRTYPRVLKWVLNKVVDTWNTSARLTSLIRNSQSVNLALIHAQNDAEIPSGHSENLFLTAANATTKDGMDFLTIYDIKERRDMVSGGFVDSWTAEGTGGALKRIKLVMSPYGGHNQIMTYPLAAKEILDCFDKASR